MAVLRLCCAFAITLYPRAKSSHISTDTYNRSYVYFRRRMPIDTAIVETDNTRVMIRPSIIACTILMFVAEVFAQQTPALLPRTDSSNMGTKQFEPVFTSYQRAYEQQDFAELLAVWPTLSKDAKEFKKIKRQFDRADIAHVKLVVEPHDVRFSGQDDAVVQCSTSEQYVQLEKSGYYGGDAMLARLVAQTPGPLNDLEKRKVKKTGDVWMTLHRDGDQWTIVSVSHKKPL